jgi:hypothetical protein
MSGVKTSQLSQHADRPGACWMVADGSGKNAGVIERAGPGKFGAWHAGSFLGEFAGIEEAAQACLQVHGWEGGRS